MSEFIPWPNGALSRYAKLPRGCKRASIYLSRRTGKPIAIHILCNKHPSLRHPVDPNEVIFEDGLGPTGKGESA